MSKVTASKAAKVAEAITSRRLSAKQVREGQEAATRDGKTIASNGQILDVSTPGQVPRIIEEVSAPTTD